MCDLWDLSRCKFIGYDLDFKRAKALQLQYARAGNLDIVLIKH